MTTLYHGSYAAVPQPQVAQGRRCLRFAEAVDLKHEAL